jgi:7-keto-8-aminopelargonate synthetase-like enzyme
MEGPAGTTVLLDGKRYLYFAGTSYFNLHQHPVLIRSAEEALEKYGLGSATSRSHAGNTPALLELERTAASFFVTEDAVYLPSGYLSNLAGLQGLDLSHPFQRIYLDDNAHYSLCDAAMATGKPVHRYGHLDAEGLELLVKDTLMPEEHPLIASDGLFPISGKMPPAGRYLELAGRYGGLVWLDDAHGSGVLGASGRGTVEELGLAGKGIYTGTTLSKAFGAYGGVVPGAASFTGNVRKSGPCLGSNAPLSTAVAAGIKGLEIVRDHPLLRERLWGNALYLKKELADLGLPVTPDHIPIASFKVGTSAQMSGLQQRLMEEGIYIQYTTYRGSGAEGLLRIVVTSGHDRAEIDRLIQLLGKAL